MARQLRARAQAELRVDAREVALDRADADEHRRRDLAVRPALGDELGHAPLRLGQLARASAAAGDARELGRGLLGPQAGAQRVEELERLVQGLACVAAALRAALH